MVKCCVYKSCTNNSKNKPSKKFYPFVKPKTDEDRAKIWISCLDKPDFTVDDIKEKTYVCEDHFLPDLWSYDWTKNSSLTPLPIADSKDLNLFESKKKQKIGCILNHFEKDFNLVLECASKKVSLLALLIQKLQLVNDGKTLNQLENDLQNAQNELSKFAKGSKSDNSSSPYSPSIQSPDNSAKKICSKTAPSVTPEKKYCTISFCEKTYDLQTAQNELSKFAEGSISDSSLPHLSPPIRSPNASSKKLCTRIMRPISTPGKTNLRKCIISSCNYYFDMGMFKFPKNLDLKRKWLDVLNMDSHQPEDMVCKKHFDYFYILANGKYILDKDAVPSLCLPPKSQSLSEKTKNCAVPSNKTICEVYIKQEAITNNSDENSFNPIENRFESGENKRRKFMCKIDLKQEPMADPLEESNLIAAENLRDISIKEEPKEL